MARDDDAPHPTRAAKAGAGEQRRAKAANYVRSSRRSKDNEPPRKKTLRDYGRQFGIMWGVLLLLQIIVIVIYRAARGFALEGFAETWPSDFEANFLIFLPLVLGLGAIGLTLISPGNVRGLLLVVLAIAPWLYAFNLEAPNFEKVYPGVPTAVYSIELTGEEAPEFDRRTDHLGNELLDHRTAGLVQTAMRTQPVQTPINILPGLLILLLCLAPSFAVMTVRRYLPGRRGPQFSNLAALLGIGLFYGLALPWITPTAASLEAALEVWGAHWATAVIVALPALAGVLHLLDLLIPIKLVNAITRLAMKGAIVLLVAYWGVFAAAQGLHEFWQHPDGVVGQMQVEQVDEAGERYVETVEVLDDPGQRFARISLHSILLWVLLIGNLGILVTGLVDLAALALVRPDEGQAHRRARQRGSERTETGVPATDPGLPSTDTGEAAPTKPHDAGEPVEQSGEQSEGNGAEQDEEPRP